MDEEEILQEEQQEEAAEINLATVTAVTGSGIKIQIDGESGAGDKTYKCNTGAAFKVGDRVRIKKDSGTYIVEFPVGSPGASYPLPTGGSTGQVLAKSSNSDYAVQWVDAASGIPSGGSTNQVLRKKSNTNYDVEWGSVPSPTGLANGSKSIELSSTGYLTQSGSVYLGSSSSPFAGLYINGTIQLGTNAYGSTVGFFGATPQTRKSISQTASVSDVITALKSFGLFY